MSFRVTARAVGLATGWLLVVVEGAAITLLVANDGLDPACPISCVITSSPRARFD